MGENLLDAMNLRGDVCRREPGHLTDARGVLAFEVEEDDLAVRWREAPYEFEEAVEGVSLLDELVHPNGVGKIFYLLQADEMLAAPLPIPEDVGDGDVVGHPIDPRS
jgi:hypothetical protein